jgi:oligopeptide/dipeptide ABC transporter ATP-binding protein
MWLVREGEKSMINKSIEVKENMDTKSFSNEPLIRIENLKKYFHIPGKGELHAVDDVTLDIKPNETLGLVGESGCGKTTVGNVLLRLIPETSGRIYFHGGSLLTANKKQMVYNRRKIQMIFQDPYSSLNPRKTVRNILEFPLRIHKLAEGVKLNRRTKELAEMVGLEPYILDKFPHELDGGKRQMVGIARALALEPDFIVCDEPVSSLDVSVQATIINLLIDLQKKMGLTYLFISHDLSVVRHISNRVAVMYLGQIVEQAPTDTLFSNTIHPYSIALLLAVPRINFEHQTQRIVLKGDVPSPLNPAPGCRFAPRCWMAQERCSHETPELSKVGEEHYAACHFWKESQEKAKILVQN